MRRHGGVGNGQAAPSGRRWGQRQRGAGLGLALVIACGITGAGAAVPGGAAGAARIAGGSAQRGAPPQSGAGQAHLASVTPLDLANFVIVDPLGAATSHSGPVDLALGAGGQHLVAFDSLGYRIVFSDYARPLVPGEFSTSVDAWVGMTNDPACIAGTTTGGFRIDQAVYDASGSVTTFAVRFSFRCWTGTRVYGTIAYQLLSTMSHQGYYLYSHGGDVDGLGNDGFLLYLGDPALLRLGANVVGMAPTPSGSGYWEVAADGGIFAFGDAGFFGSLGGTGVADVAGVTG